MSMSPNPPSKIKPVAYGTGSPSVPLNPSLSDAPPFGEGKLHQWIYHWPIQGGVRDVFQTSGLNLFSF